MLNGLTDIQRAGKMRGDDEKAMAKEANNLDH